MFSTVIRHPMEKMQLAPIVFVQYLAAMAVVKGIKTYDKGYEQLPIKMKWPNDVCKFPSRVFERYTDTRKMDWTPRNPTNKNIPKSAASSSTPTTPPKNTSPSWASA